MRAVDKDLMAMKVDELKEELEARDEVKTGNKACSASAALCGDCASAPRINGRRRGIGGRVVSAQEGLRCF